MSTTATLSVVGDGQLTATASATPPKSQAPEPAAAGRVLGSGDNFGSDGSPSDDGSVGSAGTELDRPRIGAQKPMLLTVLAILQPSLINFLTSFTNGVITVALPSIARSVDLPRSL